MKPEVTIEWRSVARIAGNRGHGIELSYGTDVLHAHREDQLLVAFVDGFGWMHGTSNIAVVEMLQPESNEFKKRHLDGNAIITDAQKALSSYLLARKLPYHNTEIGKHLLAWINA